jgi:hypothetical protein
MAITKIQSESLNLSDNYDFTGTVTGAGEINTPASVFVSAAGIVNVSAGDTIDCRCFYNAGSPELQGSVYTDGRWSFFEGFKILT